MFLTNGIEFLAVPSIQRIPKPDAGTEEVSMKKPTFWVSIIIFIVIWVCGCAKQELNVEFDGQKAIRKNATVRVDGNPAGFVKSVQQSGNRTIALIVIKKRQIAETKLRQGIVACAASDGGIELDSSNVRLTAPRLLTGAWIKSRCPETPLLAPIIKYANKYTLIAAGVGLVLLLVGYLFCRLFFKMAFIVICLLLSLGAALVLFPILQPWVETLYEMYPPQQLLTKRHGPVVTGDKSPSPSKISHKTSAGKQLEKIQDKISAAIQTMPRPHPAVVAFVTSWFVAFVVISIILSALFRPLSRKK